MLSRIECERLAAMANTLRPEWPVPSVATLLWNQHKDRAYRDLAVALAYIATDPATLTPGRLAEAGPWWRCTEEQTRIPVGRRIPCPFHDDQPASRCTRCREEAVPPPPNWRERTKESK